MLFTARSAPEQWGVAWHVGLAVSAGGLHHRSGPHIASIESVISAFTPAHPRGAQPADPFHRRQRALGKLTPIEFETIYKQPALAA